MFEEEGYTLVENRNEASIAVYVDYGISGPQDKSYNRIVFGQTGVRASPDLVNGGTDYDPTYGVTGTVKEHYTVFTRYLTLQAINNEENSEEWYRKKSLAS